MLKFTVSILFYTFLSLLSLYYGVIGFINQDFTLTGTMIFCFIVFVIRLIEVEIDD